MYTAAAFSTNEPPPPNNDPPQSPSSFSTLPKDLVLNILARVTRYHHPILSRVSKTFRSLVRSSELRKTRSLQGNDDSFYVCFRDFDSPSLTYHWFTLDQNRLVSILFPPPPEQHSTALMIGHEIYLVGGHINRTPCKSMWIIDSRNGELRQGPSMRVARRHAAVGLVDEKIYVFGGGQHDEHNKMQAEVFDTKTQNWDVAPNPEVDFKRILMSVVSPSLDRKIYAKNLTHVMVYDPRDGKCDKIDLPNRGRLCSTIDLCEVENVLYIYFYYVGLMWYDSKKMEWRTVKGLKLGKYFLCTTTMVEYNGKLALLREHTNNMGKTEIWCSMVALEWGWNALEIVGKVEWSHRILLKKYIGMVRMVLINDISKNIC